MTIKTKEKADKSLVDEAILLITNQPHYLNFQSITSNYLELQLKNISETNYKKLIPTIEILLNENINYLETTITELQKLIANCKGTFEELSTVDKTLNILYSELIHRGFSKGFLYKLVYGIFVNSLEQGKKFKDHFNNFKKRVLDEKSQYKVIFRLDTSNKVYDAISSITNSQNIALSDNIDDVKLIAKKAELKAFNAVANTRKYLTCCVEASDYLAGLKIGRSLLSEYLDVINLGMADEFLNIHNRVLVVDERSPLKGNFQNNANLLDGKYKVEKEHYNAFAKKLPLINNNPQVASETKEKIKSAIRYLRLGNQSVEMEHKFINYWIGLEYLFSNYESSSTIERLKMHFINAHTLAYTKRNIYSFRRSFLQLSKAVRKKVPAYLEGNDDYLKSSEFYKQVYENLMDEFPLLAYRAGKIKQWMFEDGKEPNAKKYIIKHKENLEVHFTRIYRLRNEIIHDAATNTNNEQISSNLRYYLTFILNEIIEYLSKNISKEISIEDYFILNEIKLGNIEQNGSLLKDLLEVDCAIDFIS